MSIFQTLRCRLGRHKWGTAQGVAHGVLTQVCADCGKTRRLKSGEPPQGHDRMDIHQ
jgi:hypothetical protein